MEVVDRGNLSKKIVSTFVPFLKLELLSSSCPAFEWTTDSKRIIQFKIVSILKFIGVNDFCNMANNYVCLSFQKRIF